MKVYGLLILIWIMAYGVFQKEESTEKNACLDCHQAVLSGLKVHSVASEDCSHCHKTTGEKHPGSDKEAFTFVEEGAALCYTCHTAKNTKSKVHAIVAEGECTTCHMPHSSDYAFLLAGTPSSYLCEGCHDLPQSGLTKKHGPAAAGECTLCHNPHQSNYDYILLKEERELCTECHVEQSEASVSENVHPPFENACSICHDPHGSDINGILNSEPHVLCFGCHTELEFEVEYESNSVHNILFDSRSCMNCHDPHSSKQDSLLIEEERSLCLSCHTEEYRTDSSRTTDIGSLIATSAYIHSPVTESCVNCHNPHNSAYATLLSASFPPGDYFDSNKEEVDLCFQCHEEALMLSPRTLKVTSFRNGNLNLHHIHMNGTKSRSCVLCHDVHASANEHLIANEVSFGKWSMQLNFVPQDNGGSCSPACHELLSYSRE